MDENNAFFDSVFRPFVVSTHPGSSQSGVRGVDEWVSRDPGRVKVLTLEQKLELEDRGGGFYGHWLTRRKLLDETPCRR